MNRRTFMKSALASTTLLATGGLALAESKVESIKYDFINPKHLTKILNYLRKTTPPENCNQPFTQYERADYNNPRYADCPNNNNNYNYSPNFIRYMEIYLPICRISNILYRRTLSKENTWVVMNKADMDLFEFCAPKFYFFKPRETGHPLITYWGAANGAWSLYTHENWQKGWFLVGKGKALSKKRNHYSIVEVIRKKDYDGR